MNEKEVQEFMNSMLEFKSTVEKDLSKYETGSVEYNKRVETLENAVKEGDKVIAKMKESALENQAKSDDVIRLSHTAPNGMKRDLTLTEAVLGGQFIYTRDSAGQVELMDQIKDAMKNASQAQIEKSFEAIVNSDPDMDLAKTHPRRQSAEAMYNGLLDSIIENAASGATPQLVAASMYPDVRAGSTVWPLIPMEPRLSETGKVTSTGPFSEVELVESIGQTLTDSTTNSSTITLDATEFAALVKIPMNYMEDYAFGSAVADVLAPTLRRAGFRIDQAVLVGSTNTTAATAAGIAGTGVEARDATLIQRKVNGFAAPGLVAASDAAGQRVDAGGDALTVADLATALGLLGQDYGTPAADVVAVLSHVDYWKLLTDSSLVRISVNGAGMPVIASEIGGVGPMPFVIHDIGARQASGLFSQTPAQNTTRMAVVLNRMMAKQGFVRGINVRSTPQHDAMSTSHIVNFRYAFAKAIYHPATTDDVKGVSIVRNIV